MIINQALEIFRKMDAGLTAGFSIGHPWQGRGDGWSNATGPAIVPANHKKRSRLATPKLRKF
jgi:hypothetical protein